MKVINKPEDMQKQIKQEIRQGKTVGFVPTMGFLHEGHLELIKQARVDNDLVVLSIFVNPLQFGPNEDYERYPRDLGRDEEMARSAGVDYLFYPEVSEMYKSERSVELIVKERVNILCGASRPGHFDGVATVLVKLFNIVMPDRAYFGMKDAQQVAVVKGLVDDFNIPVQIIPVEIVREKDGLAMSSRNVYLSNEERKEATGLYESLRVAKEALLAGGERNPEKIKAIITKKLSQTSGEIDYIEILSYPALTPLKQVEGEIIIAIAVKFEKARLIDNIVLNNL